MQEQKTQQAAELETESLIHYIINNHHHDEILMLNLVENLLNEAMTIYSNDQSLQALNILFSQFKEDLILHFAHEEQDLYPRVLKGEKVDWSSLNKEHFHAAKKLQQFELLVKSIASNNIVIEDLTLTRLVDECCRFIDDLHHHMFLENMVLFKRI